MISTDQTLENLTFTINQEIHVKAPLETTFAALLEQLGPGNETPEGKSLNLKIEPWPGGTAIWATEMGISGPMCRPSSGPRCLSSPVRSSPLSRSSITFNID